MRSLSPCFRLDALPAADAWMARTALTDYVAGPCTAVTVRLKASGLVAGDIAGLVLRSRPYAWIGVERGADGLGLVQYDERTGISCRAELSGAQAWLRVVCDLERGEATFWISTDGKRFSAFGRPHLLTPAQDGIGSLPCSLFCFASGAKTSGGRVEFGPLVMTAAPREPGDRRVSG